MFTKKFSASDLEDLLLLAPRVFSDYRDPPRGKFAIVYNFSETTDNDDSGLGKIVELARADAMMRIGVCNGFTANGYDGHQHSVDRLDYLGFYALKRRDIPVLPINVSGNVNTLSEAEALVRYAAMLGGDIGIVAPAFHLMRAFMTTVSAMYRLEKNLRVYAIMGVPLSWTQRVRHSQGTLEGTREQLLSDELMRLEKYQAPEFGSMLNAVEVLEYMDWRDAQ